MHADDESELEFEVDLRVVGKRLDSVLADLLNEQPLVCTNQVPTRTKIAGWIADGQVTINFKVVGKSGYRLRLGDLVRLTVPPVEPLTLIPDPHIRITPVYEDDDILVLDKPANLVVHPGAGAREGTLVHGLLAYLGKDFAVGEPFRPGLVHRLDKDTSGLMVIAKHDIAYQGLVSQFLSPRTIKRNYLALAIRAPSRDASGIISKPIGRSEKDRKKMAVVALGKPATTEWSLVAQYRYGVLLRLELHTGRTHQIRVHLQSANAGILGDPMYGEMGNQLPGTVRSMIRALGRQALHASELSFIHPLTKELVAFASPMPEDMRNLESALKGGLGE